MSIRSMKTIVENGVTLEVSAAKKLSHFGVAYWQARYSFPTGDGSARLHGVTYALYATEGAAEAGALLQARGQGWGSREPTGMA